MTTTNAMNTPTLIGELAISDQEFARFRDLVRAHAGITLGPQKRHLLRARLGRRLRALGMTSFAQYYDYLTDPEAGSAEEILAFINAITTHKTDFFREPHHFEYLRRRWAKPGPADATRGRRRLRLWSAACSSGEEPYTLAMILAEAGLVPPACDTRILASDIDTDCLAQTEHGIYTLDRVGPVPHDLLKRYFVPGPRRRGPDFRVKPELRSLLTVRRINLAEPTWPIRTLFHVIFCRNALIYFDRAMQKTILERLVSFLEPGGLLFLGHAESVFGLVDGLSHLGNTIYARTVDVRAGMLS